MGLANQLHKLQRLDGLIRRKQTGSPQQLANRLGISVRSVFRLLSEMKDLGLPVAYSSVDQTYYYTKEVRVDIKVLIDE